MREVVAGVPDVPGGSRRSLKVPTVVPDVDCGRGRSLQVPAVVPDVPGGRERSLVVAAVVPVVPGGSRKALKVVAGVPDVPGSSGMLPEVATFRQGRLEQLRPLPATIRRRRLRRWFTYFGARRFKLTRTQLWAFHLPSFAAGDVWDHCDQKRLE